MIKKFLVLLVFLLPFYVVGQTTVGLKTKVLKTDSLYAYKLQTINSSTLMLVWDSTNSKVGLRRYAALGGTVTSVDATAGNGISVTGGPVTTTGTFVITNTKPDTTVVLNSGTGITISGTYPNFTVTNSALGDSIWRRTGDVVAYRNVNDSLGTGTSTPTTDWTHQGNVNFIPVTYDSTDLDAGIQSSQLARIMIYNDTNDIWGDWVYGGGAVIDNGVEGQLVTLFSMSTGKIFLRNNDTTNTVVFDMFGGDNITLKYVDSTWVEVGRVDFNPYSSCAAGSSGGDGITYIEFNAGTGIGITGSPVSGSAGAVNIVNTAPDQTVVINAGTGISVVPNYPTFTITNTQPSLGGTLTGVEGVSPISVVSSTTTATVSIALATAIASGYLSYTDWNIFNNKLGTTLDSGKVWIGNTSGVATARRITTDLKIFNDGTAVIQPQAVTTTKIADNNVDGTKLFLTGNVQGDIMYFNGTDWVRLAPGTANQILKTNGGSANPEWATITTLLPTLGTVTNFSFTNANGFTGTVTNPTTTPDLTISLQDAQANGVTKGQSTYLATDFNSTTGLISIDYDNGRAASSAFKGFLKYQDWQTFNGKQDYIPYASAPQTSYYYRGDKTWALMPTNYQDSTDNPWIYSGGNIIQRTAEPVVIGKSAYGKVTVKPWALNDTYSAIFMHDPTDNYNYTFRGSSYNRYDYAALSINRPWGGAIYFAKHGTPQMTLDSTGRLGIGTTPTEYLHVKGKVKIDTIPTLGTTPSFALVDNSGVVNRYAWPTVPSVSGTTNYLAKFTGATSIGNSRITDDGAIMAINGSTANDIVDIIGNTTNHFIFGARSSNSNSHYYTDIYYDVNHNLNVGVTTGAYARKNIHLNPYGGKIGIGTQSPDTTFTVALGMKAKTLTITGLVDDASADSAVSVANGVFGKTAFRNYWYQSGTSTSPAKFVISPVSTFGGKTLGSIQVFAPLLINAPYSAGSDFGNIKLLVNAQSEFDSTINYKNIATKSTTPSYALVMDGDAIKKYAWPSGAEGFVNPMTDTLDLIVGGTDGVARRFATGTGNQVLGLNAGGTAYEWKSIAGSSGGTVTNIYQGLGMLNSSADITAAGTVGVDSSKVVLFNDTIGTGGTGKIETKYHATTTFEPKITAGTTGQYWRGDKTWQTTPTGESTSVANAGDGTGLVYKDMTDNQINLRSIKAGTNVTVTNNTNDITIAAEGADSLLPEGLNSVMAIDSTTEHEYVGYQKVNSIISENNPAFSAYNDAMTPAFMGVRNDGHAQTDEGIMGLWGSGYDGVFSHVDTVWVGTRILRIDSIYGSGTRKVRVEGFAAENWSATQHPTYLKFSVTDTLLAREAMRIDQDRTVKLANIPTVTGATPTHALISNNGVISKYAWPVLEGGGTVTGVTGTWPIYVTGTTTPDVAINKASATDSGYLTSADWSDFDSRLPKSDTANQIRTHKIDSAGSIIVGTGNNTYDVLKAGALNTVLTSNGYGTAPEWREPTGGSSHAAVTLTNPNQGLSLSGQAITSTLVDDNDTGMVSPRYFNRWDSGYIYRVQSASGTSPLTLNLTDNGLTGEMTVVAGAQNGYVTNTMYNYWNGKLDAEVDGSVTNEKDSIYVKYNSARTTGRTSEWIKNDTVIVDTTYPRYYAGTNITRTGSYPNYTINATAVDTTSLATKIYVTNRTNPKQDSIKNPWMYYGGRIIERDTTLGVAIGTNAVGYAKLNMVTRHSSGLKIGLLNSVVSSGAGSIYGLYSEITGSNSVNSGVAGYFSSSGLTANIAISTGYGNNYFNSAGGNTGVGYASGSTLNQKFNVSGSFDYTDRIYINNSAGSSGNVLMSQGSGSDNIWKALSIDDMSDVDTTGKAVGNGLGWNGSTWVPTEFATGSGLGGGQNNIGMNIGTGIGVYDGKIDTTLQFRKLNGVGGVTTALNGTTVEISLTDTTKWVRLADSNDAAYRHYLTPYSASITYEPKIIGSTTGKYWDGTKNWVDVPDYGYWTLYTADPGQPSVAISSQDIFYPKPGNGLSTTYTVTDGRQQLLFTNTAKDSTHIKVGAGLSIDSVSGAAGKVFTITNSNPTAYTHPAKAWVDKSALTGNYVISNLSIDATGHPTDWTTRELTIPTNYWQRNSTNVSQATLTDRVGIGMTNPTEMLDVLGNINIPTTSSTVGIIKMNTNRFIHAWGTDNLFAGLNAGNLTMTGSGENVGLGNYTLYSNTSGEKNVAVGISALYYNTTGVENMAIGGGSLSHNTTGNKNTAIGYQTMVGNGSSNTTGSFNTAIGNYALGQNITGFGNTAIGASALKQNSSGYHNTAIGDSAYLSVSEYNNSTAIGYNAQVTTSNQMKLGNTSLRHVLTDGVIETTDSISIWKNNYEFRTLVTLGDDVTLPFYNNAWGHGTISTEEGATYAAFRFTSTGVVTLLTDCTIDVDDDSAVDNKLCIYDGGTNIIIKNRLGGTKVLLISITYSQYQLP